MKGLGRINIRKGFNAILITVILFTSLIFSLYFYFDKKQEYGYKKKVLKQYSTQNQKTVLKHEVESVINYIDYVRDEYKELPDSMIKMIAMKRIEKIRFEHGGYVFVNSYQGQALVYHGAVATGYIDVSDLTDPDGKKLFKLELKAANNPDGEYMTYKYKPIGSDSIMPKISFMKGYNDWQWIIGAGFYLQDINRELSTIESEYL